MSRTLKLLKFLVLGELFHLEFYSTSFPFYMLLLSSVFMFIFFSKTKSLWNNIGVLTSLDLDQESSSGSKLFVNVYQQTIKVTASKERVTSLI